MLLSVAKRQPVVLTRSQGQNTGHLRGDIFWLATHRRRPRSAPRTALVVWVAFRQPLKNLRAYQSEPPILIAHTSHVENHLVLGACICNSFARFSCRSLVRVFALIDISVSHLVNRKPIDKMTESASSSPPVAHFAQTTQVNLDAIPTRTRTHGFTQVSELALFVCCSNSLLYTRDWYDPPGRPMLWGFKRPLFILRLSLRRERCSS